MKFLNYLNEAESAIRSQLEQIKNGTDKWDAILRSWLTGKESAFDVSGPKYFRTHSPKEIPVEVKKKYPDVVFALQALTKHMGASSYYDKWIDAQKYLTFKTKAREGTYYRFWSIDDSQLKSLKDDKSINVAAKAKFSSYSRHNRLFRKDKNFGITVMTIGTENLLRTKGQGLTLVTKHKFTPIFDLFYFAVDMLNSLKRVFKVDKLALYDTGLGTIATYVKEKEVIGPPISTIKPDDVEGYYKNGTFNELKSEEYLIKVDNSTYTLLPNNIKSMQDSYKTYGSLDYAMFNNTLIITSNLATSHLKMYCKTMTENKELSKLLGFTVWTGIWK